MIKQTLIATALFLISLPVFAAEMWMYNNPDCSACQLWMYQVGQDKYNASPAGQYAPLTHIIDIKPMVAKGNEISEAMNELHELRAKGSPDSPVARDLVLELLSEFEELTPPGWNQSMNAGTLKKIPGTPTFIIVEKNSDGLWVELARVVGYNGDPELWLNTLNIYIINHLPERLERLRNPDGTDTDS